MNFFGDIKIYMKISGMQIKTELVSHPLFNTMFSVE